MMMMMMMMMRRRRRRRRREDGGGLVAELPVCPSASDFSHSVKSSFLNYYYSLPLVYASSYSSNVSCVLSTRPS